MNKGSLLQSRSEVEQKFNTIQQQITKLNEQLYELRGEYRALTVLIEQEDTPADQAGVIDVEPTLKESDKKGKK